MNTPKIPTTLVIEPLKYLLNIGWRYYLYCGLTTMWVYCSVCKKYTFQTPYTKAYDYKYVCKECNTHSFKEFHKELVA